MPKTKISEYSATANSNTDVASINIDEGCAPSGINNAIRAVMGHLKDFQQGTNGDPFNGPVNGTVGATTPSTGAFTTLSASSTVTLSGGTANGVAYLNGSKVLTTGSALTFDGTNLSTGNGSFLANGTTGITSFRATTTSNYAEIQSRPDISYSRILSSAYLLDLATLSNQPILFTINSTEQMRLTSTSLYTASGINVGIGTSSPAYKLQVANNGNFNTTVNVSNTTAGTSSYARFLSISDGGNASFGMTSTTYTDVTSAADSLLINASGASGGIVFAHDGVGKMLLDSSGNLLVGKTNTTGINAGAVLTPSGGFNLTRTGTAASDQVVFYRGTAGSEVYVGTITTTGTATSYVTSSDYRLKNTIAPMTGALAKVAALKPVTYKWNVDGSDGEGFIAHELAEVVPQCVTGEKDALDADGNPKYQGIDTSFLVATLTAAIQEQQAIIQSLTARITALESA